MLVGRGVKVRLGVKVGVIVGVSVGMGVEVNVGVNVGVKVGVIVGVLVGVLVGVWVRVALSSEPPLATARGAGVGAGKNRSPPHHITAATVKVNRAIIKIALNGIGEAVINGDAGRVSAAASARAAGEGGSSCAARRK